MKLIIYEYTLYYKNVSSHFSIFVIKVIFSIKLVKTQTVKYGIGQLFRRFFLWVTVSSDSGILGTGLDHNEIGGMRAHWGIKAHFEFFLNGILLPKRERRTANEAP
jgi:hypothetical protein